MAVRVLAKDEARVRFSYSAPFRYSLVDRTDPCEGSDKSATLFTEAMNFIQAIIAISKRSEFELCDDQEEINGKYNSICVYRHRITDGKEINKVFVGKLRWPKDGKPAIVDKELEEALLA